MLFSMHRRMAVIILALPICYTLLFGSIFYSNVLTDVPILVCNKDEGVLGRNLVRDLMTVPEIRVEEQIPEDGNLALAMNRSNAAGAIVIPEDFTRSLETGKGVSIEVIIDNTNTGRGGAVTKALQAVTAHWDAEYVTKNRVAAGWIPGSEPGQLVMITRLIGNPTGGYEDFFLVPLILHAMQIACVFSVGPSLVLERKGRRKTLAAAPWRSLLAKLIVYWLLAVAVLSFCLALGGELFQLANHGTLWQLMALSSAFLSAILSFAFCVGSWVRKADQAVSYPLFYIMPSILFTGAFWPRYSMDSISLLISYLVPVGYVAEDFRSMLVTGTAAGWESHVVLLMIYAVLLLCLAAKGLKKERREYHGYIEAGTENTSA